MAFKLEHFPTFPYPSKMKKIGDVENYLTNLYRSLHDFFSMMPMDIKGGIGNVDLDDLANTTLVDPNADRIVFWDDSAGVYTWLTANTGLAISTTNLNLSHLGIEALTDPNADRVFFWDDSAGASKWLTATEGIQVSTTNLKANIGGLSADATPDAAADYVMTLDATDSTHKKALIEKLVGVDVKVAVDSGATADYLGAAFNDGVLRTGSPLTYTDGGNYVTLDWAHLGFESLADPGGDRIAFWDDSETALKWLAVSTGLQISTTNLTTKDSEIDHGSLAGLDDGDHDAVYYTETEIDTWRNSVTQTEMGYVNGVTSDIQTQLDARCLGSVFGTSIGTGILLDGTVLKTDVELQAIAGLTSAADRYIRFTGSGAADLRTYANVLSDIGGALSGGAEHDGFSDYVANEHIDYTNAIDNSAYVVKTTEKARVLLSAVQLNVLDAAFTRIEFDTEDYDPGNNFNNGTLGTGTATGTTANHLIDSGYDFAAVGIEVGMRIKNTTDTTYTYITAIAVGDLTLRDDIFVNTDNWEVLAARFIVPVTGYYSVMGSIGFKNLLANKAFYCYIRVNSVSIAAGLFHSATTASLVTSSATVLYLTADDYIDMRGYHNAGIDTVDIDYILGRTALSIHLLSV